MSEAPLAFLAFRFPIGFNQRPSSLQVVLEAAVDFHTAARRSPGSLRNSPPDTCTCSDCFLEAEVD